MFTLLLGSDRRMRIRTGQWLLTVPVYVACGVVFNFAGWRGWIPWMPMVGWSACVLLGLTGFYMALRSGWSTRFEDGGLTSAQIVFGILVINWGYLITGPFRTLTLLAALLGLTFGAFSLSWRRIVALGMFAAISLSATVVILNLLRPRVAWSLESHDFRMDLVSLAMLMVMVPAVSMVAARLSSLRAKLRTERNALTVALQEVQRLATRDELTGLANRRHMQQLLGAEESRFRRRGHAFSIAVIDLDQFKRINDLHGHATGDQVLRTFAEQVGGSLRGNDVLARWGGEEFLLLMPDTRAEQATTTVGRLLAAMRHLPTEAGAMSFSAGVAEFGRGDTMSAVLARADEAMYAAKRAGRNRVMQG